MFPHLHNKPFYISNEETEAQPGSVMSKSIQLMNGGTIMEPGFAHLGSLMSLQCPRAVSSAFIPTGQVSDQGHTLERKFRVMILGRAITCNY